MGLICPLCEAELLTTLYETTAVRECPACKGHLLSPVALEKLKWTGALPHSPISDATPRDVLQSQAQALFKGSTPHRLRCPSCRNLMHKERLPLPAIEARSDVCSRCNLIWLDPGELPLLLLAFRASPKYSDTLEMRRRSHAVESDPERRAAFEDNLASLPANLTHREESRFTKYWLLRLILRILLRF